MLSFRFMEPLEESVYLDQVQLLAVDHPAGIDVYPNEYFASNPPYPRFKVVLSNRVTRGHPPGPGMSMVTTCFPTYWRIGISGISKFFLSSDSPRHIVWRLIWASLIAAVRCGC